MLRRVFSILGLLQLTCLAALAVAVADLAIVIWHQTDDYFTPLPGYLGSLKIAFPPAVIFVTSYVVAVFTGASLAETPKLMLAYCRNRLLQSISTMCAFATLVAASTAFCGYLVLFVTPPAYERFVGSLFGGSSDSSQLVKASLEVIGRANPSLAAQLQKVVEVFAERSAINAGKRPLVTERAQIYVRSLEARVSKEWAEHPLRKLGAAEAYLLYGQSMEQTSQGVGLLQPGLATPFDHAIQLLEELRTDKSPLVPPILRASAMNNLGNAYYYKRDNEKALEAWQEANSPLVGRTNLGSWSNVIAALVLLGRLDQAIVEGEKAKIWAAASGRDILEPYPYSGLLGNLAFAKLQNGDVAGALGDFATAHAFQDDDLTIQNLALALIVHKRHDDAKRLLRRLSPPAGPEDEMSIVRQKNISRCVFFIWALASQSADPPERAANLLAFLGEEQSPSELKSFDRNRLAELARRVEVELPKSAMPCATLGSIKAVTDLITQ